MIRAGIFGGREMAETDEADPNADLPTQRLPREAQPPLPSDAAAGLAAHMLEPTIAGGVPRSTPPTLPMDSDQQAGSARPPAPARPRTTTAPRPVLGDRYELLEELGRGGMGVVYRAHDRTLGRDIALKVLQVAGRVDAETIERFQREARAAAALDHPNIVRVHDVGALPDGAPYYTMELLSGQDLAHAITDGHISPKEAVEAVRQVSLALFYAHQKGILHRDLKPQNIFLRRDPALDSKADAPTVQAGTPAAAGEVHALLLDFGLAKLAESDLAAHADQQAGSARGSQGRKSMQSLTRSGEIFGTPAYMPPEQTHGAKDVDARADIYSLGAALYHALAGRTPFEAACLAELLYKVQRQDPSPPSQLNADIDADLDTLTLKCLQKDPKDRYQNAGELAEDLKRWLAGDPISARPIGLVGRVWRKAKRNKAVAIPVAILVAAALIGGSYGGVRAVNGWRLSRCAGQARTHLSEGRFKDAEERARQAIDLAPEAKEYQDLLAQAQAGTLAEQAKRFLDARDYGQAESPAREAAKLAPTDTRYRDLLNQALAGKAALEGAASLAAWRTACDRVTELDKAWREADEAEKKASAQDRPTRKHDRWTVEEGLRTAKAARDDAWPAAVARFTQAVKLWPEQAEACDGLTGLYWDRYLRAEQDRDRAAEATYGRLVGEFGGDKYKALVRCEREVHVTFLLPLGYGRDHVDVYVFEYEHKKAPPIEVPVPFEQAKGLAADDAPELADEPAFGKPVPLAEATSAPRGRPLGRGDLPPAEAEDLAKRASTEIAAKRYAHALPLLERLSAGIPENREHPYNLACCLAVGAREPDAGAWLAAAIGKDEADHTLERMRRGLAGRRLEGEGGWKTLAVAQLEEAVRRGWDDPAGMEKDEDLAALRQEPEFLALLAALRGQLPRRLVLIDQVVPDSQAATLGLRADDVVRTIAGQAIETTEQGPKAIQSVPKGQAYEVVVWRAGTDVKVTAKGGEKLGVQLALVDLAPEGQSPASEVRAGSVYALRRGDSSRLTLQVGTDSASVRRSVEFRRTLVKGSYLLWVAPGQGLYETRYPFVVARDIPWDETCEVPAVDDLPPTPPGLSSPLAPRPTGSTCPPDRTARAGTPRRSRIPRGTQPSCVCRTRVRRGASSRGSRSPARCTSST